MPCKDDYPIDPADTASGIKAILIPLLCEACDTLERYGLLATASPELRAWAKAHEAEEMERTKRGGVS